MVKNLLSGLLLLALVGCNKKTDPCREPNVDALKPLDVDIERKELELFSLKSRDEIERFVYRNPVYSTVFLNKNQYPNDSLFISSLLRLIQDPYIDTLFAEVKDYFQDLTPLETELGAAFARIQAYDPEFKAPKIQTGITGFATDLYISDSLVVIGLDFFLGRNGSYRPQQYPSYIVERFEEEFIVPNIILHLSKNYNAHDPADDRFLADMLFYGKSYVFTKSILPCTPDWLLIQYKPETLSEVKENDHIIWASLLENELLYETNHFIKRKFLEERPNVPEIGKNCPGRIAAWVGWEIMKSWLEENPEKNLNDLMNRTDVDQLFRESKYKPTNY